MTAGGQRFPALADQPRARGESGKTTGYYVPIAAQAEIRQGATAWKPIQEAIRELATLN